MPKKFLLFLFFAGSSIADPGVSITKHAFVPPVVVSDVVEHGSETLNGSDEEKVSEPNPVENKYLVYKGTFHENIERLASQFGFTPIIWDERVKNCVWEQITEYVIKETDPRAAFAYYAKTLDFVPAFSDVDHHVEMVYVGPISRIQECQNEE